jgi:NIMA (never in mitosis gene a)-related kinase
MALARASWTLDGAKWERVKVLGKGSFGEAILVRRAGTEANPVYAVCKRIVLSSMKPDERRDAINEVAMLKRLKHPNIVAYHGSFEQDDALHIFMEYANAGDVEKLISEQVKHHGVALFTESLIASLVLQIASAIKYLHERKILHRDLKAGNVFLSRRREGGPLVVKLGDFGIATVLRNTHALAKTVCGTPYYFSPELCLNKPYNSKTDIWSFGCIIYEMATLRHAFDAQNMKALVARILKGNYTPVAPKYSPDFATLIDRMLQQKMERRVDIDGVLASSWMRRHAAALCANDLMRTITSNLRIPGAEAVAGDKGAPVASEVPPGRLGSAERKRPAGSAAVASAVNIVGAAKLAGAPHGT